MGFCFWSSEMWWLKGLERWGWVAIGPFYLSEFGEW